jgi:hypothetical protein
MTWTIVPRSIVVIALVLFAGAPTQAFATTGCPLKKTPDGFVALRTGPSQTAPIVAHLSSKDVVLISNDHEQSGEWVYAKVKGDGGYGPSGWVNGRLIDNDKCS